MIGFLRGVLLEKQPPGLLLDVQGVGYEVEAPMTTFYELPALGEKVGLYTHLVVREDAHTLYGFSKASDRSLFRALIKVNGVGARLALTILSGMQASDFVLYVQAGDTASLVKLPGVGKKTAERLVVEMRDKLTDRSAAAAADRVPPARPHVVRPAEEAVSALVALGYKAHEASRLVRGIDSEGRSTEEIIRAALQASIS